MNPRSIRLAMVMLLLGAPTLAVPQDASKLLRDRRPEERPTLLVLGTAHLANPGRDQINIPVEDVLSERRQREVAVLLERLATFRPTHVAVEWALTEQKDLDARYSSYRSKKYKPSRNEVDQFALPLAAALDLERVDAVDWNDYPPGDFDQYYDWAKYAESRGQEKLISAINDPESVKRQAPVLAELTIMDWLIQLNQPERLATSHRRYFDIATIGDAKQQPGANWVGHWYARNLRIFGNLTRLTDRPDDRILAIYGQGHAYLLRQFAVESGAFRVVDVAQVLGDGEQSDRTDDDK
jgi:hypothetical protein